MNNTFLLNRALADLYSLDLIIKTSTNEYVLDLAAYHLQQFTEKMLKKYLDDHGIIYPLKHPMVPLYRSVVDLTGVRSTEFEEILPILRLWESTARYSDSPSSNLSTIVKYREISMRYLETLFNLNLESLKPETSILVRGVTEDSVKLWVDKYYEMIAPSTLKSYGLTRESAAVNYYRKMIGEEVNLNAKEAMDFLVCLLCRQSTELNLVNNS